MFVILLTFAIGLSAWFTTHASEDLFTDEVAPLLQRRCLSCHHDGNAKGDFSLSNSISLTESGYLDSEDVDASYLLEVVTPIDGKAEMPKDSEPLSIDELAILRNWIGDGAKWPRDFELEPPTVTDRDWWSLRPIGVFNSVTNTNEQDENPVDTFVNAKLIEQQLTFVEQAKPLTLIRRLTYDLTGLPPTPAEVDSFLVASEQNLETAWRAAVDRLLDSPAFGEKWGQHWLDVARYAETHGYDKDKPRENAWPYRDYVIRSFNDDKSYSRFVQEQIAGDALFPNHPDGVLGLGFLAAGPWDFISHWEVGEGKLDGRIAKHLDRDEMVSAAFNVFMSTTVQCAQCHHHKFDPIRMEDYYRLHAVFAAVDRADRVYDGLPPKQRRRKREVVSNIGRLESEQRTLLEELRRRVANKASDVDDRIAKLTEQYGNDLVPKPQYGYHSQITKNPGDTKWVQLDLREPRGVKKIRILPAYDQFNGIGAGFGFPVRYRVEVADDSEFREGVRTLLDATNEDQPNPESQSIVIRGDGEAARFVRITATKLRERRNDFMFALGEVEVFGDRGTDNFAFTSEVTAKDSIESGVRWAKANLTDGIFYQELTNEAARAELRELRARRKTIEMTVRTGEMDRRLSAVTEQLERLKEERQTFAKGQLVYAAATHFPPSGRFIATEGIPRPIHLLARGDLRSPLERVHPGTLPLWEGSSEELQSTLRPTSHEWNEADARAELARYLTRRDNPLVWRSIVNRIWLWTFGAPLVGSPNDFGRGGLQPSHPELLDYLASRLRDDPRQSLKSMVRLLVTSKTYRRSSRVDSEMALRDGANQYLWRGHRRRLTAEEFRDSLLATAGVLDRTIGGKSFRDFVILKPEHSPHYEYHLFDPANPKSHRRSVYRFVVRSQPQPLLTTLDCADPSISTPQRDESTTALQALSAWNNRLVEFASKELGERLQVTADASDGQIELACRLVLGRKPSPTEESILREHLQHYGPANLARVLFNMNAFVYLD